MPKLRWLCVLLLALSWSCSTDPAPNPTAATPPPSSLTTVTTVPAPPSETTQPPEGGTVLRVGSVVPVANLDPADAFTLPDWEILHAISDGLLSHEPGSGRVVPDLAEDLPVISDDGRTYTFTLRPGIEFADGTALTAPVYVAAIRRAMELGGQSSDLVASFVEDVEAPDDLTVVFHLRGDYAFFPALVAGAPYLAAHPDLAPPDRLVPSPEPPVFGVGPWYVASNAAGEMVLERSESYRGEIGGPDRIVVTVFGSIEELVTAMTDGDLDLAWRGLGAEAAASLASVEGVDVGQVPGGTLGFLVMNHGLGPTDDARVRSALAEVLDRGAITEAMDPTGGLEPAYRMIPDGFLGSTPSFSAVYGNDPDLSAAIELLAEAGYTEESPAELALAYPPERYGVGLAAAVEEVERQIESTGLVSVTLTAQPWNTYVGDVVAGSYNLAFLDWLYDFPDPHNYLAPFVLEGGLGGSGVAIDEDRPELRDLILEAAAEHDEGRRAEMYESAQVMFAEDVVTLPLWFDHEHVAYRDHVRGDPGRPYPETLNIGPMMQLDYGVLRLGAVAEG